MSHVSNGLPRNLSILLTLVAVAGLGLSTLAMVLGKEPADPAGAAMPAKVPASLVDTGEFGENIYDAAKSGDWASAKTKLASLKEAMGRLKADLGKVTAEQTKGLDELTNAVAELNKAVPDKQRDLVMRKANQATLIAAELSAPYRPQLPVAVTRLDYLGRELEIWSAAGDLKKLQAAADDIQLTWSKLRPEIEKKGGTAEAKEFSKLAAQLGRAKSAEDYGKVATPILDQVDKLEQVFTK